jgi:hypothetical protein
MVALGDYQAHDTVGFIFGCVLAPALVLVGVPLTYAIGRKGNDKFKYSLSSRLPKLLALWRLTCFVFGLVTLGYSVSSQHVWYVGRTDHLLASKDARQTNPLCVPGRSPTSLRGTGC